jgi:hypothetical protein
VVEVQMREDDGIDVPRRQTEFAELSDQVAILVHLDREGSRGSSDATDSIGRDLWMEAAVEQDATIPVLDDVEEVWAVHLSAHVLVEGVEGREIRSVTTGETSEDLHWFFLSLDLSAI